MNNLEDLAEQFMTLSSKERDKNLYKAILENFIDDGSIDFENKFWTSLTSQKKEEFVEGMFNFLLNCESTDKIMVLQLFEIIYLEFVQEDEELKEKLFAIFYAGLFEQKNYEIALQALQFFLMLWERTDEHHPLREEIFPKLLDFIENKDPLLAEEGIFELLKLMDSSTNSQKKEFFERLLIMAVEKNYKNSPEVQYTILNTLNEMITLHLGTIKAYDPERIIEIIKKILGSPYYKHPKPIIELLHLIFDQHLELDKEMEGQVLDLLKKSKKKITYEYQAEFWNMLQRIIEQPTEVDKRKIIEPFLKDLQQLFRERDGLNPEVRIYIETLVNFIWNLNILNEKELNKFY